MNHQVRLVLDAHILGDDFLQDRFTAYVEIIGYLMWRAPRPAGVGHLVDVTHRPAAALKRCFHELAGGGILKKSADVRDTWHLAKDAREVTLEDVFRCTVGACTARRRRGATSRTQPAGEDIDLLLTQALQTVDDHLYRSLRTYSLDRFIVSRATPFPAQHRDAVKPFAEIVD